jgi:hypothetical protein
MHGEERGVTGVEIAPEIETAFLDPVLEIGIGDFVGPVEERIVWLEEFYLRVFVG